MIRFGTMDRTFYCRDCYRIFNDQLWSWLAFYILLKEIIPPVALYLLDVHLVKAWRAVFNTHINFDEIVCNNKAAISTDWSQKQSISPQKTAFGCCSHPCKNTCHSSYLRTLKVVWEQAQDVLRAVTQRVCESAQGEGPSEGNWKIPAELLASAVMVLWTWQLAEGSLVLIPTPNLAQWLRLTWTKPKRNAGYKQLAQALEMSAVCVDVCSPPVLSLCSGMP